MHKPASYITELIYSRIVQEQLKKLGELKSPNIIYVTDLVSCTHKYHLRKKFPELTIVFEPAAVLGDLTHLGLEKILMEKGIKVEVDLVKYVQVGNEIYLVKGRADAVDESRELVIEVKTSRSSLNLPRDHHVKQLNFYLEITGFNNGIIIYITPEKIVEYEIARQPISIENEVLDLLNNKHHPRYTWECNYCPYKRICSYYSPTAREA
ncbi:MAG: CRISPR-associated protein Cas4 [Desulfurococcaceae archaeon]